MGQLNQGGAAMYDDFRAEGDPNWFEDGARVLIAGLTDQRWNGTMGEIVGYDDESRRYRVQFDVDGVIRRLDKSKVHVLPGRAAVSQQAVFAETAIATLPHHVENSAVGSSAGHNSSSSSSTAGLRSRQATATPPSRTDIIKSFEKVHREIETLRQFIDRRSSGQESEIAHLNITDVYFSLSLYYDFCVDFHEKYVEHYGEDEELTQRREMADDCYNQVSGAYEGVRTWKEWAQDEWNFTQHSFKRDGVVAAMKSSFSELARDVRAETHGLVQTVATNVPEMMRHGTLTIGDAGHSVARVSRQALGGGQHRVTNALEQRLRAPVKRLWHLMLTGLVLCFFVPLFALPAPFNSLVANVGLVYTAWCLAFPPRFARGRRGKAGMLVLYPVCLVAVPTCLHYSLLHPESVTVYAAALKRFSVGFAQKAISATNTGASAFRAAVQRFWQQSVAGNGACFLCRRHVNHAG